MYQITVSEEIKNACPIFKGAAVYAEVTNTAFCEGLWEEIPSRYRPSAEALRRRLMRGIALYQIDTLVDLINLVSLRTGYSIGGFDADKIQGTDLKLGVGRAEEPFEGIGRGVLNIEGLPVYRDAVGGIGTPTSDNERTKMDLGTQHILAIVNGYSGQEGLRKAAEMIQELLKKYTSSNGGEIIYFE